MRTQEALPNGIPAILPTSQFLSHEEIMELLKQHAPYLPQPAATHAPPPPTKPDTSTNSWAGDMARLGAKGFAGDGLAMGLQGVARLGANLAPKTLTWGNHLTAGLQDWAADKVGDNWLGKQYRNTATLNRAMSNWVERKTRGGFNKVADKAGQFRDWVEESMPVSPEREGSIMGGVARGLGQMAGTLPVAAVPYAGQVALAAQAVGQLYQEGYDDALAHGADAAKAHEAGLKNAPAAGLEFLGDKLIVGRILKPLKGKIKVRDILKTAAASALSEGATEGAQQVWQNWNASVFTGYDPERKVDDDVYHSALIGAIVGGTAAGAGRAGKLSLGYNEKVDALGKVGVENPDERVVDRMNRSLAKQLNRIDAEKTDAPAPELQPKEVKNLAEVLASARVQSDAQRAAIEAEQQAREERVEAAKARREAFEGYLAQARQLLDAVAPNPAEVKGVVTTLRAYVDDKSIDLPLAQQNEALALIRDLKPIHERLQQEENAAAALRVADAKAQAEREAQERKARIREEKRAIKQDGKQKLENLSDDDLAELGLSLGEAVADGAGPEAQAQLDRVTREWERREKQALVPTTDEDDLLTVLRRVKLPTRDDSGRGLQGELDSLRNEQVNFGTRQQLFDSKQGSLDRTAEKLRGEGFNQIQTPDDVIEFTKRALAGERILPEPKIDFARKDTTGQAQPTASDDRLPHDSKADTPDPFTGERSFITGSRVTAAQAIQLAGRVRSLAASISKPDARGAREVGSSQSRDLGKILPIRRLPSGGLVNTKTGQVLPEIGRGVEAFVYEDAEQGVVYKVYEFGRSDDASIGIRLAIEEGMVGTDTGQFPDIIEKTWAINDLGGTPTEIVGRTEQGEIVVKQPRGRRAQDTASAEPSPFDRAQAIIKAHLQEVPSEVLPRIDMRSPLYYSHIAGQDVLLGDLHGKNFIGDTIGRGRINDLATHVLTAEELNKLPKLNAWLNERRSAAHAQGSVDFARAWEAQGDAVTQIQQVIDAAKQPGDTFKKATVGKVTGWVAEEVSNVLKKDVSGYVHTIDDSAVRHILREHGQVNSEASRGQIAVTDADIKSIPQVVAAPDLIVLGNKTAGHKDAVVYVKQMPDGNVLYVQEVRTGREEFAATSLRKHPATQDLGSLLRTAVPTYAQSDSGSAPTVVQAPRSVNDRPVRIDFTRERQLEADAKTLRGQTEQSPIIAADFENRLKRIAPALMMRYQALVGDYDSLFSPEVGVRPWQVDGKEQAAQIVNGRKRILWFLQQNLRADKNGLMDERLRRDVLHESAHAWVNTLETDRKEFLFREWQRDLKASDGWLAQMKHDKVELRKGVATNWQEYWAERLAYENNLWASKREKWAIAGDRGLLAQLYAEFRKFLQDAIDLLQRAFTRTKRYNIDFRSFLTDARFAQAAPSRNTTVAMPQTVAAARGRSGIENRSNDRAAPNMAADTVRQIQHVIDAAKHKSGHAPEKADLGPVADWVVEAAAQKGFDIRGYKHTLDGSAVRHIIKNHYNAKAEAKRGQIALTDADLLELPQLVQTADKVAFGSKNTLNKDQIVYLKHMPDGSTLYLEEIRSGRGELAAVSARKYPATIGAESILSTLNPNVQDDSGNGLTVVERPAEVKTDQVRADFARKADDTPKLLSDEQRLARNLHELEELNYPNRRVKGCTRSPRKGRAPATPRRAQ